MSEGPHKARSIALVSVQQRTTTCRWCGASVRWATTPAGKHLLIEAIATIAHEDAGLRVSTDSVHWANCPQAKKRRAPAPPEPAVAPEQRTLFDPYAGSTRRRGSRQCGD